MFDASSIKSDCFNNSINELAALDIFKNSNALASIVVN